MLSNYTAAIEAFVPENEQEAGDQRALLWYLRQFPGTVLTRENEIAHITSSGFLMNPARTRCLMVHHNIRGCWAWTGGHADGDADLLAVAIREATEETGAPRVTPLSPAIASIDILPVFGHVRRGQYVSAHLHLSVAYLLIVPDDAPLTIKPDENTGVRWFDIADVRAPLFDARDEAFYQKLIRKAKRSGRDF